MDKKKCEAVHQHECQGFRTEAAVGITSQEMLLKWKLSDKNAHWQKLAKAAE